MGVTGAMDAPNIRESAEGRCYVPRRRRTCCSATNRAHWSRRQPGLHQ